MTFLKTMYDFLGKHVRVFSKVIWPYNYVRLCLMPYCENRVGILWLYLNCGYIFSTYVI